MKTITALIQLVYVPILNGSYETGHLLKQGESFQIPTNLWNIQDIAQQLVIAGSISAV